MKGFFNVLDHSANKTNEFTTLQNARLDLVGELEAIVQYENHLMQTNNSSAQNVIKHIVEEEKTHVGELMGLIFMLDPESKGLFEKGLNEFNREYKER
ncbi:MAG: ubiquinone biosynthesis protein COQ7 [Clostridiales bacterium]|nr:ubiquinone biosynthesis protein COQ7 [Clostridiales bacterium]